MSLQPTAYEMAIQSAAARHKVTPADILGRRVFQSHVDARMDVAVCLRGKGWSNDAIARLLKRSPKAIASLFDRVKRREDQKRARRIKLAAVNARDRRAAFEGHFETDTRRHAKRMAAQKEG